MRQLTFEAAGKVAWREVPDAAIGSGVEAIVRPLVIGRCDLDIGYVRGIVPMTAGEAIGHEMIGEIVDVGDGVRRFRPGQRVVVPAQISCGTCRQCRRGYTGRCETVPFAASYGMGRQGGFGGLAADRVRVPFADAMLFPLPGGVSPVDWIGFTDMAQDAWRAVGPALRERPGARVLVIGGLPAVIGIYAAGLAVAAGASAVDFYDDDAVRLAEAAKFGANPIRRGEGEPSGVYEIVVGASIAPQAIFEALRFAEPEAIVTSVSIHFGEATPVPLMLAYNKGVTYRTGRPNCRAHMEDVAHLCASHRFAPERLTTKVFDYDDAPAAWLDPALRTACTVAEGSSS
jgi:alcohol dehydrogenase